MKDLTLLIPTFNRVEALAVTLASLLTQKYSDFNIVISDQSTYPIEENGVIQNLVRIFALHHIMVEIHRHLPRKGIAEQRQFLLERSDTTYCLFLDDDLVLENFVIFNLIKVLKENQCAFVGAAPIGLSYIDDIRPEEQHITFWESAIKPETIEVNSLEWQRYKNHNAANPLHIASKFHISPENPKPYHIAWVGGCVLYNRKKLTELGGFEFWENLPKEHCGEDVLVQLKLMQKYGGCAILPSGVYHQELPTTLPNRTYNAPQLLY
jgi:glycosyltransferase involved in cell wall biosynthesis